MISMGDPRYVYTPRSPEMRARLRDAHLHRLGIPLGHRRIYGINVPEKYAEPLRNWASWVRQQIGRDAAVAFVRSAEDAGWAYQNPAPPKLSKSDPAYAYTMRPVAMLNRRKRLERLARSLRKWFVSSHETGAEAVDWALIEELLAEHMSIAEIAAFARIDEDTLAKGLAMKRLAAIAGGEGDR